MSCMIPRSYSLVKQFLKNWQVCFYRSLGIASFYRIITHFILSLTELTSSQVIIACMRVCVCARAWGSVCACAHVGVCACGGVCACACVGLCVRVCSCARVRARCTTFGASACAGVCARPVHNIWSQNELIRELLKSVM